jgi:hypothetical protein
MQDDYIDEGDKTTEDDYLTPEEQNDPLNGDGLVEDDDEDLEGDGLTDEPDPVIDEDSEKIRTGKFDDEEPDIDDVEDDSHPYPHP